MTDKAAALFALARANVRTRRAEWRAERAEQRGALVPTLEQLRQAIAGELPADRRRYSYRFHYRDDSKAIVQMLIGRQAQAPQEHGR